MTYTLVVGAAPAPGGEAFYTRLLVDAGHVVAADAGGEWCVALGRVPDLVVGDFDSSAPGARERLIAAGSDVRSHPREKDETDLELAADVALRSWDDPVALTAAYHARIDHTLAALGVLVRSGAGATVREPDWTGYCCCPGADVVLHPSRGVTVSLVAIGRAAGVTATGLRWPLRAAILEGLSGLGVSNTVLSDEVRVHVEEGILFVIVPAARS